MEKGSTVYYTDAVNDEFSGISRNTKFIDRNYCYIHRNPFWKIAAFIVYRIIMTPVAILYLKFKFRVKVVGKKAFRACKNQGYFLYGNHTQAPGDGYFPTYLTFPKGQYVIVNADNVSLKGTEWFMKMIGAMPIPSDMHGVKNFMNSILTRLNQNKAVTIYPEAHIWPYYTGIRPFSTVSFKYPIKFDKPSYCFAVTYHKPKIFKEPKIVVYVDGPFYPDKDLTPKEAQQKLRDEIYEAMCERAKQSNYEVIHYIKKENE